MAQEQQRAAGAGAGGAGRSGGGGGVGRVLICGTGRAGSSFLVRLLTRLGLDTGFSRKREGFNAGLRAGCELLGADGWADPAAWERLPVIVKSPFLSTRLPVVPVPVDAVVIPVRDLADAADSRIRAGLPLPGVADGDLEPVLAEWLGRAVADCLTLGWPLLLIPFATLTAEPAPLWRMLRGVFPELPAWVEFRREWEALSAESRKLRGE